MTTRLRLFPLNTVLFPGAALNLHVFEPRYKQLIGECLDAGEGFGVVLVREGDEVGDPAVLPYDVGSVAQILEVTPLPFGRYYISTVGRRRFRIREILSRDPYLTVEADLLDDEAGEGTQTGELAAQVRAAFAEYLEVVVAFSGRPANVELDDDPQQTSFVVGHALHVADALKQRLLELDSTKQRLTVELSFLRRLLPQLRKLVERRQYELHERGQADAVRNGQERFFGKYFSLN